MAVNVRQWDKVAVRVNPLFVALLHDMYGCSGWPSFVAVKSGTEVNLVLGVSIWIHKMSLNCMLRKYFDKIEQFKYISEL